ncbi:hypothetical protein H5410_062578 [Solanum commersonii]|uniref:Cytochrome P450 n=1 Tax=Solanum commersonii TaxID=4109 RepID=A0A9J5WBY5_SOLCO|nr:hypothetical protein H5410_062578 [Solanum commersonii]
MILIWATVMVVLFVYAVYTNIQKRKRFPPGPTGLPILGHLHLLGKNPHQDLQKLAKKHGPIMYVRLGLVPTIVVSSADAAEKASSPDLSIFVLWSEEFGICKVWTILAQHAKIVHCAPLSNHKIHSFQSMRKQEVELLIESIKMEAHHCIAVDLSAKITSLNANLTCLMVFGKKYMDEDFDKRGFKAVVQDAMHLAAMPNLGDFFPS